MSSQNDIRKSIHAAYREVVSSHKWSYFKAMGRIFLKEQYDTGTVSFDYTGGASERLVTSTGATFPSWANDAVVKFEGENTFHHIATRVDDANLTLHPTHNPGEDVTSGSYELYPLWYLLPDDFMSLDAIWDTESWSAGTPRNLNEIIALHKYSHETGDVQCYTIAGIPDLYGSQGIWIYPSSDEDKVLDFPYHRKPRNLRHSGYISGEYGTSAVGTPVTTSSTTVTADDSSNLFKSTMVNSIIRFSTAGTTEPTGLDGPSPFYDERSITAVAANGQTATIDAALTANQTSVAWVVSDPVDVDPCMYDAFLYCIHKHMAHMRNLKHKGEVLALYQDALKHAKIADKRTVQRRIAGQEPSLFWRLADRPQEFTDE